MYRSLYHCYPLPKVLSKNIYASCDKINDVSTPPKKETEVEHEHGGALRFMGYLRSIGIVASKGARYLAYTSDVGEAFRPVVHPRVVTLAYAMSWSYVLGDVGFHGYNEYTKGSDSKKIG